MKTITIIGSGMMGSALAFPARENGNRVRLVGTPLDREIIETCRKTGQHPKFEKPFPQGVEYYQIEQLPQLLDDTNFFICGVSSFGARRSCPFCRSMCRCCQSPRDLWTPKTVSC